MDENENCLALQASASAIAGGAFRKLSKRKVSAGFPYCFQLISIDFRSVHKSRSKRFTNERLIQSMPKSLLFSRKDPHFFKTTVLR